MLFLIKICLILILLTGCGSQGDGYAPAPFQPTDPDLEIVNSSNSFKYGQAVTTSNGWEASLNMTNSFNELFLNNGWAVEVQYE